ncbi:phage portal protein [Shouchella clausii]|uniref:phage portal protein n=1 Tax=Shouchella clausii TaxID=79880 RepID=UPI003F63C0DA
MGSREFNRICEEIKLYRRYEGDLTVWTDYVKPDDIDYDPSQITLNYPRKLIDTIAAWQFEKEPKVVVPPDVIDDPAQMVQPGYTPSAEQQKENTRAKAKERLLTWVWDDNRMHEKLLAAAKDRAITRTGVYARLHYDKRRGDIRIYWHPSTEVIPVYDEWDCDELKEVHFAAFLDEEQTRYWRLSYYLEWDEAAQNYDCKVEEWILDDRMQPVEQRTPKQSMGLDFIPVVQVPADKLTGSTEGFSELEKIIDISEEIDRKLSDFSDALKFEMFAITVLKNVDEDPKNPLKKSPAAIWNLGEGTPETGMPHAEKLDGGFQFKEAIEAYIDRMYRGMHDLIEVPLLNTADMKVGGLNDVALQQLYAMIISKTQRAWVVWQSRLQTLNEYILRYMKARQDHPRFKYDKEMLKQVDEYYDSEIVFNLPMPQDREALITLLGDELANGMESIKGAIARSGKENAEAKFYEIMEERNFMQRASDPYNTAEDETRIEEETEEEEE